MKANLFAAMLFCTLFLPVHVFAHTATKPLSNHAEKAMSKIDLNKADSAMLAKSIKGIGQKRAEAIIKFRESHDGFKSIEELAQVPGLGKQFVKNHLTELQQTFYLSK